MLFRGRENGTETQIVRTGTSLFYSLPRHEQQRYLFTKKKRTKKKETYHLMRQSLDWIGNAVVNYIIMPVMPWQLLNMVIYWPPHVSFRSWQDVAYDLKRHTN